MRLAEAAADVAVTATSMACHVTVRALAHASDSGAHVQVRGAVSDALSVFTEVDRTCTRFSPDSDLMRANRHGDEWVAVDRYCFLAIVEAYAAYRRTHGRFDPRVLDDLVRLGYDASYSVRRPRPRDPGTALSARPARPLWQPRFRDAAAEVMVGPEPVDLGGIGKGLAVRWVGDRIRRRGVRDFLVEAGGDCLCAGQPPDAPGWRVSVEDPGGGHEPLAVLQLRDEAVATSSVRVRSWEIAGEQVHHLIDPTTGTPGGVGLNSVTVIGPDPADAEVWSKVLFLAGRSGVATTAEFYQLPALWVDVDGAVGASRAMGDRIIWTAA